MFDKSRQSRCLDVTVSVIVQNRSEYLAAQTRHFDLEIRPCRTAGPGVCSNAWQLPNALSMLPPWRGVVARPVQLPEQLLRNGHTSQLPHIK